MGMIWGYLAAASSGAIAGLLIAAGACVLIGKATSIFCETSDESAADTLREPGSTATDVRKRSPGDLNVVRYLKLCQRFDDALIKIEEVLDKDPDFVEARLLKAQILWEGFEDAHEARECLSKILALTPDEKEVFHRWALNFYEMLSAVPSEAGGGYGNQPQQRWGG